MTKKQKKLLYRIITGLVLFVLVVLAEKAFSPHKYILPLLYLVPYFVTGYDVLWGCVRKISQGKLFDEEFLMTVATVGALVPQHASRGYRWHLHPDIQHHCKYQT